MEEAEVPESPVPKPELERCFRMFVASHRDRAQRLAWRLIGGDDAAAEDVAQEAFVKAYRALGQFREEAHLATWFYRILVRQAHTYRRWHRVRQAWNGIWQGSHDAATTQEPGDPLLRRRIAEAIKRLSSSQKEAFVLVHLEGFSVREAAGLLDKPEGTVKSHLHRALCTLRHELADLTPERVGGNDT